MHTFIHIFYLNTLWFLPSDPVLLVVSVSCYNTSMNQMEKHCHVRTYKINIEAIEAIAILDTLLSTDTVHSPIFVLICMPLNMVNQNSKWHCSRTKNSNQSYLSQITTQRGMMVWEERVKAQYHLAELFPDCFR